MVFLVFMKHFCTVSVLCHQTTSGLDSETQALDLVHGDPGHLMMELLISICLNVWNLNNIEIEEFRIKRSHSP